MNHPKLKKLNGCILEIDHDGDLQIWTAQGAQYFSAQNAERLKVFIDNWVRFLEEEEDEMEF